mmetsp:Transcript_22319/g.34533  ORF Transcript_22319/g.34533 Transcript_22319/m.34533 type:complete len:219 (+) Transcript_22319:2736-3392(+)
MFTYYQMALERAIDKSKSKIQRELEISTMMKRIRDSDKLCRSFEQSELFFGLRKRYKFDYTNVINVSLDTQQSLNEEYAPPIQPPDVPFQRKKFKHYREVQDGYYHGQHMLEPFDLDRDTMQIISKTVWKKLKQDGELMAKVQEDLKQEMMIDQLKYAKGIDLDRQKQAKSEKSVRAPKIEKPDSAEHKKKAKKKEVMDETPSNINLSTFSKPASQID